MTDHENLLVLAGWLVDEDWTGLDIDAPDRYEAIVQFGLGEEMIATEADANAEIVEDEFHIGREICKLTELGKTARIAWLAKKESFEKGEKL